MMDSNERDTQAASPNAGMAEEPGRATDALGQLGGDLEEWDRTIRAFVREQPLLSLLGALALGYGIGRALSS